MSPGCILKAKQPRPPRARLGTVSGCHWTCIWIIQSYSAIFKKEKKKQKPWGPGVIRHHGLQNPDLCATVPTAELAPLLPHPPITSHLIAITILHSAYTIQGSILSKCTKYWAPFCSHWAHQVAREHVTVSFSGSSSSSWHGAILLCSWVRYGEALWKLASSML